MQPRPVARVIGMRTNGEYVNAVLVQCVWCSSAHWHVWGNETDSFRYPPCQAGGAAYLISVDAQARIDHMRTEFPSPDGVVGLVPLHVGYAYERDGDDDIIGIVLDTPLGRFAVWLPMASAIGLAGHLVEIAENREALHERYLQRAGGAALARLRSPEPPPPNNSERRKNIAGVIPPAPSYTPRVLDS
jgi:hypothetical protein